MNTITIDAAGIALMIMVGLLIIAGLLIYQLLKPRKNTLIISFFHNGSLLCISHKFLVDVTKSDLTGFTSVMNDIIQKDGIFTVSDVLSLFGKDSTLEDENYGWADTTGSKIVEIKNGFELQLPPARLLIH